MQVSSVNLLPQNNLNKRSVVSTNRTKYQNISSICFGAERIPLPKKAWWERVLDKAFEEHPPIKPKETPNLDTAEIFSKAEDPFVNGSTSYDM